MSGIDAVKRIVETEEQARKIVEEARQKAQEIVSRTSREAEKVREQVLAEAQKRREDLLVRVREDAEKDAEKSDMETNSLIQNYQRAFEEKKDDAVRKAVDLVIRA